MTKKELGTFIPHSLLESIMFGKNSPSIKSLMWIFRNTFGWNRKTWNYTKSLLEYAADMKIPYTTFLRTLKYWESKGLITLDKQNCILKIVYTKMCAPYTQKCTHTEKFYMVE